MEALTVVAVLSTLLSTSAQADGIHTLQKAMAQALARIETLRS